MPCGGLATCVLLWLTTLQSRQLSPEGRRTSVVAVDNDGGVGIEAHPFGIIAHLQAAQVLDHPLGGAGAA
jgi:hypothetical protein